MRSFEREQHQGGPLRRAAGRSDLLPVPVRADEDVCADVRAALGPTSISCTVVDGRVLLTGRVDLRSEVLRATSTAGAVTGVVEVTDRAHFETDDVDVAMPRP